MGLIKPSRAKTNIRALYTPGKEVVPWLMGSSNGSISKTSSYMMAKAGAYSNGYSTLVTQDLIDLTEWDLFSVHGHLSPINTATTDLILSLVASTVRGSYMTNDRSAYSYLEPKINANSAGTQVFGVDIKALSGMYYLRAHVYGNVQNLTIYRAFLAKGMG